MKSTLNKTRFRSCWTLNQMNGDVCFWWIAEEFCEYIVHVKSCDRLDDYVILLNAQLADEVCLMMYSTAASISSIKWLRKSNSNTHHKEAVHECTVGPIFICICINLEYFWSGSETIINVFSCCLCAYIHTYYLLLRDVGWTGKVKTYNKNAWTVVAFYLVDVAAAMSLRSEQLAMLSMDLEV